MTMAELGKRLAKVVGIKVQALPNGASTPMAWSFTTGGTLWVFPETHLSVEASVLLSFLNGLLLDEVPGVSLVRLVLPLLSPDDGNRVHVGLGMEGISARGALISLLDLPSTFIESQHCLLHEALAPLRDFKLDPVPMSIVQERRRPGEEQVSKTASAAQTIADWARSDGADMIFVEAEAGKGKTVLLATVANALGGDPFDRLPLYVPLRRLPLEMGVGWSNIAQLVGAVDVGAERLRRAVQEGLVVPLLDGIDEVAGRYDRKLIRDLLDLLSDQLAGDKSVVVLAGRRTEARQLSFPQWRIVGLELPEVTTPEFERYVRGVLDLLIREWNEHTSDLPEAFRVLFGTAEVDDQVRREVDEIRDWIIGVFPVVGMDRSLFFIQGLAAIGVGRRAGNRLPLKPNGKSLHIPIINDVCLAAAIFSCLRERKKIDALAADRYSVERQLGLLRSFALLSSATDRTALPTPNQAAAAAFAVDPVNENEAYVAITRQNAKHALLYATEAAGSYRPNFLSDWVRCALLSDALLNATQIPAFTATDIPRLVAGAERARLTFTALLPAMLGTDKVPSNWLDALNQGVAKALVAASGNAWQLRAAVGDERMDAKIAAPIPLAEIDGASFVGACMDGDLSGSDYLLDDSEFQGCFIQNVKLNEVSLSSVAFRGCTLREISFIKCDGPIQFENCIIEDCRFENMRSAGVPALLFLNCQFRGEKVRFIQHNPAFAANIAAPVANFSNCVSQKPIDAFFEGDWVIATPKTADIRVEATTPIDEAVECLRQVLSTFSPVPGG